MDVKRRKAWTEADDAAGVGRPLQPYDWIRTGLDLLVSEGAEAVRITRLAAALQVTRGSFYWHFKDRADLLQALIAHWERTNTSAILEALGGARDLADGILALFEVWVDSAQFDPRLDSALRDWGRHAPMVHRAVETADRRRVAALAQLFARDGYEPDDAVVRARSIYFGQVGYYALDLKETLAERCRYLEAYFLFFTGRSLDPAAASAFRAKHLPSASLVP